MPRYSKSDPAYKAGYRAAEKDFRAKRQDIARRAIISIEKDLSSMSGLPVMLWTDRDRRQALMDQWCRHIESEMEDA